MTDIVHITPAEQALTEANAKLRKTISIQELTIEAQVAEIERLKADAERYQWLKKHPSWLGWEHDFRPDEVEREIDAAMKESK